MGEPSKPTGPDLAQGIPADDIADGSMLVGHVGDNETALALRRKALQYASELLQTPFAVVRVDRDTGQTALERLMVAYDVSRAVNPLMLDGQLVGGAIQGVGGALFEEFTYDPNGEPLAVSFADYLMPTVREAIGIPGAVTRLPATPQRLRELLR